jgi:FtsH-binding integral membrane protein
MSGNMKWKVMYDNAPVINYIDLNTFLKKVFLTTGLGIFGILMISTLIGIKLIGTNMAGTAMLMGFLISMISSGYIAMTGLDMKVNIKNNTGTVLTKQPVEREIAYLIFILSVGLMLSPLMSYYIMTNNSDLILAAVILSISTTAATVIYVIKTKPKEISVMGNMLYSTLANFVLMSLLSIIIYPVYPQFLMIWRTVDIYGGILLFVLITAYDTYKAMKMHKNMNPDYIKCAVDFCLDFLNLFVRIIELLPKKKK